MREQTKVNNTNLAIREKSTKPAPGTALNSSTKQLVQKRRVPNSVKCRGKVKKGNGTRLIKRERFNHVMVETIDLICRAVLMTKTSLTSEEPQTSQFLETGKNEALE